ncbi:TrbI/VirB10 family protein [Qipengyuania marisflavi]|uniref:TrbI/VirB10 family protein n=1 Tax=Qipengyuania marisflavi TaxID=2486356 RepID=A0A5S3P1Q9_9SPHN|nr:TrbI/VirB10 family protein [Qipengyuania marisflavi]TMM46662.1 TrbI/VirB10 family protein [Qipengyuania marisflavi]
MADTAAASAPDPQDVRPVVRTSGSSNLGLWAFVVVLLLGGAWIFSLLSSHRAEQGALPTTIPAGVGAGRIAAPPPIAVPDRFLDAEAARDPLLARRQLPPVVLPRAVTPAPDRYPAPPQRPVDFTPAPITYPVPAPQPATTFFGGEPAPEQAAAASSDSSGERARATRLTNPSLTVPLGTVIPAVLETALDSTRPGLVRALVQRDIFGFDGSRVLIPRGSRLYGEYESDLERGQNRALVRWTRLLRPDGAIISLDSPASDPLGRAGVKGKVDGKFLQQFGSAILQTALDIGVGVATRRSNDGVVVALPGSTQNISGARSDEIRPTLKVRHGTSVSVFVARDLDFSGVDS